MLFRSIMICISWLVRLIQLLDVNYTRYCSERNMLVFAMIENNHVVKQHESLLSLHLR
jgi:hypothetical protein